MSVDFKTFNTIAPLVANSRLPILLRGRHGIGKSQVVYQLATSLERPVVERRASQMTEGDLVGLPDNTDKEIGGMRATTFNPPDWFLTAVAEPVVLFFDEVDRAVPEVRQGLFELMDSRKLNGITIHPDTVVIAAINGGEHGPQYQVHEMDPAELDRYTVFDVEPTVEDWLAWGKDNVAALTWDFINNNRTTLSTLVTSSRTRFILHVALGIASTLLLMLLAFLSQRAISTTSSLSLLRSSALRLLFLSATSLRTTQKL